MRVVLGDMSFEDKLHYPQTRTWDEENKKLIEAHDRQRSNLDAFLKVAERCYLERYGTPPERTTVDEF